jgi:dolichol kinase
MNHQELGRKIVHMMIGIIALLLIIYNIVTPLIIFIILIIGTLCSLISLKYKIPILSFFLDNFGRHNEKGKLPGRGIIFAVVGSLLALQLFDRNIALASIIILTFADPVSHLIGKLFGKTKSFIDKRKNIDFVHPLLALAGALSAMLFEAIIIEIQKIELDDNLIIPLAAGTTMFLIVEFLL